MSNPIPIIERVRKFREKKYQQGCRQVSIFLTPEDSTRLKRLKQHFGLELGGKFPLGRLVSMSIKSLYNKVFKE